MKKDDRTDFVATTIEIIDKLYNTITNKYIDPQEDFVWDDNKCEYRQTQWYVNGSLKREYTLQRCGLADIQQHTECLLEAIKLKKKELTNLQTKQRNSAFLTEETAGFGRRNK